MSIENSKPVRQRKVNSSEGLKDWSRKSGSGKQAIVYHNALIVTANGVITGSITAGGNVRGHSGLKVQKCKPGLYRQIGI